MLEDLVIVLGTATLVAIVFYHFKLPYILGFFLAGVLLGPHGFALLDTSLKVSTITEIAAILLMFTIGLEFSFKRLLAFRRALLTIGLGQVLLTVFVTAGLASLFLDISTGKAFFLGFLISLSSTATVLKLLTDNRDLQLPFGQSSLSVLLLQDLAVIPMILVMPFLAYQDLGGASIMGEVGALLGKGFLTVVLVAISSKYLIPLILGRVVATRSREVFFFFILFVCIGTAFLMHSIGLSLSLGAFIAGMMISESPYGKQATSDFQPLKDNFLSLFFISIGMLLNLEFLADNLTSVLLLSGGLIFLKLTLTYLVMWSLGFPSALSGMTALILCQMGEFSFILADHGMDLELLSPTDNQYFLSASIMSLALTPFLYRLAKKLNIEKPSFPLLPRQFSRFAEDLRNTVLKNIPLSPDWVGLPDPTKQQITGHTIILGFGIAGQNVAKVLKNLQLPYRVVEMNSDLIKEFHSVEPIIYGDASEPEILHQVQIESARLVVISVSGKNSIEAILRTIKQVRPDVKIIIRAHYFRDVELKHTTENTSFVVGEFETTLELLVRVLSEYGVASDQIHRFVAETRDSIHSLSDEFARSLRRSIEMPKWEVFSSMRPIVLEENSPVIGHTLADLALRQLTGASVIAIYREGLGTSHPDSSFQFASGDVVYLLGNEQQLKLATEIFKPTKEATPE